MPIAVDAGVPEQRILEQAVRLPEGGAVTGWAALRMHRGAFFDGWAGNGAHRLAVPLAVGRHGRVRADDEVAVSREQTLDEYLLEQEVLRSLHRDNADESA